MQVSVNEWILDLSSTNTLPGYPKKFAKPLTSFTADDLQSGRRFQVWAAVREKAFSLGGGVK